VKSRAPIWSSHPYCTVQNHEFCRLQTYQLGEILHDKQACILSPYISLYVRILKMVSIKITDLNKLCVDPNFLAGLYRTKTGIVASKPARDMVVCLKFMFFFPVKV